MGCRVREDTGEGAGSGSRREAIREDTEGGVGVCGGRDGLAEGRGDGFLHARGQREGGAFLFVGGRDGLARRARTRDGAGSCSGGEGWVGAPRLRGGRVSTRGHGRGRGYSRGQLEGRDGEGFGDGGKGGWVPACARTTGGVGAVVFTGGGMGRRWGWEARRATRFLDFAALGRTCEGRGKWRGWGEGWDGFLHA